MSEPHHGVQVSSGRYGETNCDAQSEGHCQRQKSWMGKSGWKNRLTAASVSDPLSVRERRFGVPGVIAGKFPVRVPLGQTSSNLIRYPKMVPQNQTTKVMILQAELYF